MKRTWGIGRGIASTFTASRLRRHPDRLELDSEGLAVAFREAPGSGTRVGGPPTRRGNKSARHRDGLHISSGPRGLGWVAPPA